MENKKQLSPEKIYELQAYVGFTTHFGGLKATRELVELCHIDKEKYVLDVGCGTGKTPCYLAKRHGCRAVGVDISKRMIDRANERAKKEGVEDRVEFRVADAQNLPFEDDLFDVVIGEAITALLEDRQKGVSEYVRVTKPGGYVGLIEATWIKIPPPKELVEYLSRTYGFKEEIPTSDGWKELLKGTGLRDLVVRTYKISGLGDRDNLKDVMRAWHRVLSLYVKSPAYRKFVKEALTIPKTLFEYLSCGIYVGRK